MSKPIDEAVAIMLSHYRTMSGLSIEYAPSPLLPPDKIPVLKDVLQTTAYRPQLGPQPAKGGGTSGASQKLSVLDYLTDICGSIGHSIRVQGTAVIIQRVRSLMTNQSAARADDPFKGRSVNGSSYVYRRFIFGRNIKELKLSRNFAKTKPTNVEVRCYDSVNKTVLVARFPLPNDRQSFALPGNAQTEQKWTVIRVSGIKDKTILRGVAQSYYENIGRNELMVEVKTQNLASFGGGSTDPDILDMVFGDTFELLVNQEEAEVSTLTKIEKALLSQPQGAKLLRKLGFTEEFAAAYAKAHTNANFLTLFRMKQMRATWGTDSGISLNLTGVNYITVRADKSLPEGEEPSNTVMPPDKPPAALPPSDNGHGPHGGA
jgi:hypothetical protein